MNWYMVSIIILSIYYYQSYEDKYILNVCPLGSRHDKYVENYYRNYTIKHAGDSGIDLVIPYNGILEPKSYTKINLDAIFVLTRNNKHVSYSYLLYARSSLALRQLVIPNGVGVIDAGFRGELSTIIYNPNNFTVKFTRGDKFAQICANDLSEIVVQINCNIPDFGTRGSNGFGSTS